MCIVSGMSVAQVLLGVLADGPAHGYDLKRAHDSRFPGTRPLAFGQVYAALAKLQRDGLVEVVETGREGGPDRTTYALTESGAEQLTRWLADTEPAGPYAAEDLVRKTVTALRLGRDASGFLSRQRQVHLTAMKQLVSMQESAEDVDARIVIDHAIEHLDADLRWLTSAAARVGSAASHGKARR
jgi:DNA-binding PadR family transcriptional regulator